MTFPRTALSLLALALLAAPTFADSFKADRVPADAKWFAHADMRGAIGSQFGQLVLGDLKAAGLDDKIEAIKSMFGVNPLQDFQSITLFGTGYQPSDAVAIIQMGANTGKLRDVARLAKEYEMHTYRECEVHSWIEDKGPHAGQRKYCGVWPNDMLDQTLLVFADTEKQVTNTIDLLAKRGGRDLSASESKVLGKRPGAGAFLFVAGDDLAAAAKNDPQSAMLQNARNAVFEVGESDGKVYAHAVLEAADEQQAAKLSQMAQGFIAMVQLGTPPAADGGVAPIVTLSQALQVKLDGTTITADFAYPADQLYTLLKQMKAEDEARKAARQAPAPAAE